MLISMPPLPPVFRVNGRSECIKKATDLDLGALLKRSGTTESEIISE
jgi:hypothetical protein